MPGMTIEVAADQIEIVRPCVERVRGRMNTKEATARTHEIEKHRLLRAAHGNFTARGFLSKFQICLPLRRLQRHRSPSQAASGLSPKAVLHHADSRPSM